MRNIFSRFNDIYLHLFILCIFFLRNKKPKFKKCPIDTLNVEWVGMLHSRISSNLPNLMKIRLAVTVLDGNQVANFCVYLCISIKWKIKFLNVWYVKLFLNSNKF